MTSIMLIQMTTYNFVHSLELIDTLANGWDRALFGPLVLLDMRGDTMIGALIDMLADKVIGVVPDVDNDVFADVDANAWAATMAFLESMPMPAS